MIKIFNFLEGHRKRNGLDKKQMSKMLGIKDQNYLYLKKTDIKLSMIRKAEKEGIPLWSFINKTFFKRS